MAVLLWDFTSDHGGKFLGADLALSWSQALDVLVHLLLQLMLDLRPGVEECPDGFLVAILVEAKDVP